jgi:hypothetical protein
MCPGCSGAPPYFAGGGAAHRPTCTVAGGVEGVVPGLADEHVGSGAHRSRDEHRLAECGEVGRQAGVAGRELRAPVAPLRCTHNSRGRPPTRWVSTLARLWETS